MLKNLYSKLRPLIMISPLIFILSGCLNDNKVTKETRILMGTFMSVSQYGYPEKEIIKEAFQLAEMYENKIKVLEKSGDIPEGVYDFAAKTLELASLSKGYYDPSVGAFLDVWGISDHEWRIPQKEEITGALENTGWEKITLAEKKIVAPAGMKLGFGASAKGWIIDKTAGYLKQKGINKAIVEGGGDLTVFGDYSFRIGLRDPRGPGIAAVFSLKNAAAATSGDYENYFELEGVRYCHIIDPKTGYTAGKVRSATVIAPDCHTADALATALFVAPDEIAPVLRKAGYPFIIISEEGHTVSGIELEWIDASEQK